jgi:hypothetical protein
MAKLSIVKHVEYFFFALIVYDSSSLISHLYILYNQLNHQSL